MDDALPIGGLVRLQSEYQKAALAGRRFVTSSEVAWQGRLDEELVESLTGIDSGTKMKKRVAFNDEGRHIIYYGIGLSAEDDRGAA